MSSPELSDPIHIFKMDIDLTCSISKVELPVYISKIAQVKCKNTSYDLMNKLQPDYLITPCAEAHLPTTRGRHFDAFRASFTRIKRFM